MLLVVPYLLAIVGIPGLLAIPFYFLNKYLQAKLKPRESGKNLLIYFIVTILAVAFYTALGIFGIIWVATLLK